MILKFLVSLIFFSTNPACEKIHSHKRGGPGDWLRSLCSLYHLWNDLVSMKTFSVQAVLIWRRRRDGFQENPEGTEGLAEGPSYCLQCWFILISFWFPSSANFFPPVIVISSLRMSFCVKKKVRRTETNYLWTWEWIK